MLNKYGSNTPLAGVHVNETLYYNNYINHNYKLNIEKFLTMGKCTNVSFRNTALGIVLFNEDNIHRQYDLMAGTKLSESWL